MRRLVTRAAAQARAANPHRPQFGFAPPSTSLQSSAQFFVPQRWRVWNNIGPGENIGHVNDDIPGEKDSGILSTLKMFGEKTPEAAKANAFKEGEWNPQQKRTGVLGRKVGMMNVWDARGVKTTLTVIKLDNCQVVQVRKEWTQQGEKYINLQVGCSQANVRRMNKALLCHFRNADVEPKKKLCEFRVTEDAILPVGTRITARHFVPGQYVDITGTTKGKGFAGVMKRWNFKGQAASHGVSLTHRHMGSTGQCQDPGKVWKGKKMPGRMGNKRNQIQNFLVYKIDVRRDLIFVKGSIPGNNGGFVEMKDAMKKKWNPKHPPPFPTYEPQEGDEHVDELVMDVSHLMDPFKLAVA